MYLFNLFLHIWQTMALNFDQLELLEDFISSWYIMVDQIEKISKNTKVNCYEVKVEYYIINVSFTILLKLNWSGLNLSQLLFYGIKQQRLVKISFNINHSSTKVFLTIELKPYFYLY